ncbi:hypothetical protein DFR70_12665 [Nocardia tenerifensis]|uniref:Uncharacterized protein n=1 Tax=Nocardia tenerifensis TaxID=228006 RepID=A0A318JSZ0_9NOCA|nr:hypothetical protein [Nocardia tenerifensis]PXX53944.1 hypothetical protein DFR70_12665 [Nocardia tenerifensis]
MSEPVHSPDHKPPDPIEVTARYLEAVLDQALSAANETTYLDVDANGALVQIGPDDTTAEAAVRAEEKLTQYLHDHRTKLGEDQHWRAYYNGFDRAEQTDRVDASATATSAEESAPRAAVTGGPGRTATTPFAFGAAPAAAAKGPGTGVRRVR